MYNALALGRHKALEVLLRCGGTVHLHSQAGLGITAVHLAALGEDVVAIQTLARECADPDAISACDAEGRSALHYAAAAGSTGAIEVLLGTEKIYLDAVDAFGLTPLAYALLTRQASAARVLLNRGASPRVVDKAGNIALGAAVVSGVLPIVQELLERFGEAQFLSPNGCSMLHLAAEAGDIGVIELLVQQVMT